MVGQRHCGWDIFLPSMGLEKLSKEKIDFDPNEKARSILNRIPSKSCILEAYLFGSAVSGNMTVNSDLDLLLVVKDQDVAAKLYKEIYSQQISDIAIDWIIKTQEEFDAKKSMGGVCFEAFNHGYKLLG